MKKYSRLISLLVAIALILCAIPVMASAEATELHLGYTEFSGYTGRDLWLYAYDENDNNFPEEVTFTSSDPTVAYVFSSWEYEAGISLLSTGTATITATYGNLSATCVITVKAPEVLTLDTPMDLTLNGATPNVMATFTPAEAGTYTIYIPETTGDVGGYVENMNVYGDFGTDPNGNMTVAAVTLAAGETCNVYVFGYGDFIDCTLTAIKTPALESCQLDAEVYEIIYIGAGFNNDGRAFVTCDPVTAGVPDGMYWKIKDESVATLYHSFGNFCYFGGVKVGQTELEVYDSNDQLIDSAKLIIKDAADVSQPLYWGVKYNIDTATDQVYMYTPSVTDTYTFTSTGASDGADPCVDILVQDQGVWITYEHFDDYEGLDFFGETQLEKGTEYMIVVSTLNEVPGYTFTMKGTDASNPYDLKKVDAAPATCTADGNIAHYKCQNTGLLFADAEATTLAGDVVIKAEGHKLDKVAATKDTIAHEKCSVCGALFVDGKEVTSVDNPATGDTAMLLPMVGLVVLSIAGLAVTVIGKKKAC